MPTSHFPRDAKAQLGAWTHTHTKSGVDVKASGLTPGARQQAIPFQLKLFGIGNTVLQCRKNQILFRQGDPADAVFYIEEGRVGLEVLSPQGQRAVIAILETGFFVGDACLAGEVVRRATAISLDASTIMRIDKAGMIRALHDEPSFSELFMSRLLTRTVRIQEDLVDQLFNSAEKRLARTLLSLAHVGEEGKSEAVIPKVRQETLAEMVGTTRARVSFFMNRFKKLGYIQYNIEYNGDLHVHRSLLNVVLDD